VCIRLATDRSFLNAGMNSIVTRTLDILFQIFVLAGWLDDRTLPASQSPAQRGLLCDPLMRLDYRAGTRA